MYLWAIHFSFIGDESIYFPQELFATMELKLFWEGTALGSKIYGAYYFLLMILFFKLLHHRLCVFLTAILHRGLRNDFFSLLSFTFSNFSLDFYFPFLFGLLFLFFLFGLLFSLLFLFSFFSLDFYFPFSFWTFIQSRSHFGFLPNF